ncbi:MAG: hypothetical protein ACR2QC_04280 [Gammaproteobacteria bacterium]
MVDFTPLTPPPNQSALLQALGAQLSRSGRGRRGLGAAGSDIGSAIVQAIGLRKQKAERAALTDATRNALAEIAAGGDRGAIAGALVDVAPRLALQLGLEEPEQGPAIIDDPTALGFRPGTVVQEGPSGFKVVQSPIKPDTLSPEAEAQKLRLAEAGRDQINIGPQGQNFGDPPKDHIFGRNQDGTIAVEPVPGTDFFRPITIPIGPAAVEEEEKQEAERAAQEQKSRFANIVTRNVDDALKLIRESKVPVTGLGSLAAAVPGSTARDVAAKLDTIRANVGFDRLQALRDASPTGGALGQVSEQENRLLQSTIASLDQAQSQDEFVKALGEVKKVYLDIIHGPTPAVQTEMPDDLSGLDAATLGQMLDSAKTEADAKRVADEIDRRLGVQ